MKTLLIFGASLTNGVGGERGGWADKLKVGLHQEMFGSEGKGQICSVYELGIPGNTVRDIVGRFEIETLHRITGKNPDDVFIIFSGGTNDSRATDRPENYLYTTDEFAANIQAFIGLAKKYSKHILCVGLLPVDESKTTPKHNPLTGGKSYFTNRRLKQFEETLAEACKKQEVTFLPFFETAPKDWIKDRLIVDGIHPNDAGHEWIFNQVRPKLQNFVEAKS